MITATKVIGALLLLGYFLYKYRRPDLRGDYLDPETPEFQRRVLDAERRERDFWLEEHS